MAASVPAMSSFDLAAARRAAEQAALAVAPALVAGYGRAPVTASKSDSPADVVTALDLETERRLAELLGAFDAGIAFRGEEFGGDAAAATTWLVDPIDGTGHFVRGVPWCSTMISLIDGNEVVVAVIHCFATGELYSAAAGQGATLNGEPTFVSDRSLQEAYLVMEMDLTAAPGNAELRRRIQQRTGTLDLFAAGYPNGLVTSGRLDGRLNVDPFGKDWDYAPGALLVREAGGVVANLGSTTYDYRDHSFLAVNPRIFAELTEGPEALFPLR